MRVLSTKELRKEYLDFFKMHGHSVIPSASLIPDNDPTVLFTTAGMHPLVPYLMGEKHPAGKRLANVQKCVRTGDIDEVGDATHCTFFEMLGNWSLGDYFKVESIKYSFDFLTKVLGIPIEKMAVSVFEGDSDAPRDEESAKTWQELGIKKENIYYLPKENNWWGPAGMTGPCGPDTEIFFIRDQDSCSSECSPACNCGKFVEIWNNVFMEYDKQADGTFKPLKQKNVDTGMGLERTVAMLNGCESVYDIDVFAPVMKLLREKSNKGDEYIREMRIITDHIRTATFMLGDQKGITPSNVDQGYVLRRLIRRSIRFLRTLGLDNAVLAEISKAFIDIYAPYYSELAQNEHKIIEELNKEAEKFGKTLEQGLREFEKLLKYIQNKRISGKAAFKLYDTYGFPLEITIELAKENGIIVDVEGFEKAFKEHQAKSQAGAQQKFKGGLADNSIETAKLHTATHLLNAALRKVLNDDSIQQKGSNITAERLRFDFSFSRAMTAEEIAKVEEEVNRIIAKGLDVVCQEMPVEKAKKSGAIGVFDSRYDANVKVYSIGDYSMEICGGPHAANTKDLQSFKIVKEQSSSSGVRRIRAVVGKQS
ncbi:MAG: alanine--tRNA ligase [Clostridiales bacterium]|nr:alanine--tRNA ligase [Clostridiales bacterium]